MQAPWWSTTRGDLTIASFYVVLLVVCAVGGVGSFAWAQTWAQGWAGGWGGTTTLAWLGCAAALPGVAGVAARHRTPRLSIAAIALSCLATGLLGSSVGCFVMLFELLFTLYLLGGPRGPLLSRGLAAGLTLALLLGTVLGREGLAAVLSAGLVAAVALWLPVLWAADLRKADELREAERRRADQAARSAADRAELAVARERTRMAGELHDTVSGHLSAIALQAQAAQLTTDPEVGARILGEIRSGSVQALEQMRRLIDVLQAGQPQPETAGGPEDFAALAQRARAAGHTVELSVRPGSAMLDDAVRAAAFRVASEGVTNALKHAPGADLVVRATRAPDALEVLVENAPPGPFERGTGESNGNGLGLAQLRARVEDLGGTLHAGPTEESGWRVLARLPQARSHATPQHERTSE